MQDGAEGTIGAGAHAFADDPRNAEAAISVNGRITPRAEAMVSVFDSGFVLGDGVWEGLRLRAGRIGFLRRHFTRLYEGARTLDFEIGLGPDALARRIWDVLDANGMRDGVHIRLMVTRGLKATPYQDPRVTISPATVVIAPEWKRPTGSASARDGAAGLSLFTAHVRRTAPDMQDQKLNSHSKLNCIQACIQAAKAGADEALMLDPHGFVATCNSTHFFIVRRGALWTSRGGYCLGGVTRGVVVEAARADGIEVRETDFSLTDVYGAEEAFVTGTFAGLLPVREVDGRRLGPPLGPPPAALPGPMTARLSALYAARIDAEAMGPDDRLEGAA